MLRKIFQTLALIQIIVSLAICSESLALGQGGGRPEPLPAPTAPTTSTRVKKITTRARGNRHAGEAKPTERKGTVDIVSLWVISTPPGCKVFVDDEPRGETNASGELEVKLPHGTHMIRVSRDGYLTSSGEVEVSATAEAREVEFTLPPALTSVNIVTDPAEAEVYLDEVYKGASNPSGLLIIERVNPGQPHTLRVRKDGYQQQSLPVTSYSGQISVKLLSDSTKLKVVTEPSEAEIYLDDVYKGTSTVDGVLMIDQVNPNQPHILRAKKDGYRQQSVSLPPRSLEGSIKLAPDPVVLLVKSIKQQVSEGHLVEAFAGYNRLNSDAPDHQELARLLESILQNLQFRSNETLKRVGPYGLPKGTTSLDEMSKLYEQARKWRTGEEAIDNLGRYWDLKYWLAKSDEGGSLAEKQALLKNARTALSELSEHNLRNANLLLDMGWAWVSLNDKPAAQKLFMAAQQLKPDWAYPHFAQGLLGMGAAETEASKSNKTLKYGQAIDSFTKAISLKHDFALAYASRSIAYAMLNRHEESAQSGLQATTLDPQSAFAHFALGVAYFQKGKSAYRPARDEFNRALAVGGTELDEATRNSIQTRLAVIKKSIK